MALRTLPPYYRNLSKRLVKSPKIVFLDPGLLCFLLGIHGPKEITVHPLYGGIFESFIIGEIYKRIAHTGSSARLFYWRDRTGHEIDLIIEDGLLVLPVEIKAASTYQPNFGKTIRWWMQLPEAPAKEGLVIYDGRNDIQQGSPLPCRPWWKMDLFT